MQNVVINGKNELCFVVKDGEAATIVIPIKSLASVDYRRLVGIEAKGGEMMAAMRESRLDNGMNALVQYQGLLLTVKKEPKPEPTEDSVGGDEEDSGELKKTRRGGRRKGPEGIKTAE